MPWKERDRMSLRCEFVTLVECDGVGIAELCRRFGISRKTGYKWLQRYRDEGIDGLADRSRRPQRCPWQTTAEVEREVLRMRTRHPAWGGRKIRRRLQDLDREDVPSASTITAILHRHGLIDPKAATEQRPMIRFERPEPNDLWQMDFKGDFALGCGGRCHPLTVLDDHSRYSIVLKACANQRSLTVQEQLTRAFEQYGLPRGMLMDNGTPWGVSHGCGPGYTRLTAWLLRLDIRVSHGRPYHPQTQGKEERFHRTLKEELLRDRWYGTRTEVQRNFDPWRRIYNHERPHEALGMEVPARRYRPSVHSMPRRLPDQVYEPDVHVRAVNPSGQVQFKSRVVKVSEAFRDGRVGLRPTAQSGVYHILWGRFVVGEVDLRRVRRGATAAARLRSLRSLHRATATPVDDTV